jgi:hypothetical protein
MTGNKSNSSNSSRRTNQQTIRQVLSSSPLTLHATRNQANLGVSREDKRQRLLQMLDEALRVADMDDDDVRLLESFPSFPSTSSD